MHVLVLTAIDVEARALARHLGLARVERDDWPHYRAGALDVACVGLRAGRLEERVGEWTRPDVVVSAGACGALAPALTTGDLVVPDTVVAADGSRHVTDTLPGLTRAGALLTVPDIVDSVAAKSRLWMDTGAIAVDMESSVIVGWARSRGIRAAVVRGVSDTATDAVPADLAALVDVGGRVRAGRALRAALARPSALADAMSLGRGTAAALKSVAAALARIARA
jgi:adenosylhomocysteine nucleosidase